MEKKQTALDWYIEQNFNNIVQRETQQISQDEYVIAYNNLLKQAKQMEKGQIIDATIILWDESTGNAIYGLEYYNKTYGEEYDNI